MAPQIYSSSTLNLSIDDDLIPIFIKLPPANLVTLQFTLESYEGLGILRTLDREKGEVVILALTDTVSTVNELLESLKEELALRIIPPPESLRSDWLLNVYLTEPE